MSVEVLGMLTQLVGSLTWRSTLVSVIGTPYKWYVSTWCPCVLLLVSWWSMSTATVVVIGSHLVLWSLLVA